RGLGRHVRPLGEGARTSLRLRTTMTVEGTFGRRSRCHLLGATPHIAILMRRALSSAWLEHLPYKQGVGGSSPSAPMRGMKAPPGFSDPGGAFAVAIPASILPAFHAARSGQKLSAWSRCWSVHQRSP